MNFIEMCALLFLLAYVNSAPMRDLDPVFEEIDRCLYEGTSSNAKLRSQWRTVRRYFIRRSNTTEALENSTMNSNVSGSASLSEVNKPPVTSGFSQESGIDITPGSSLLTQTTFSPLKVHYDDYNYPGLAP
ncbi:unnamed protein product [Rodentolepis nana]|uniref:MADF domain-containing protein n=1 Tax=Rodentolepis nana TaxID=102285 RepID=A0A0R3TRQ0_RODNA|nr:unnamed protein product [Rodentolepis nana]